MGTLVRSQGYNTLVGADWLNDEKWPKLDMKQCERADQVAKENTIRSAFRFKFNALLSRGITLEGTPHLDSMSEFQRREFCNLMADFGIKGLLRAEKYGMIFWCWFDHPTFTKIPRHLDPDITQIRYLRSTGYRTIYHVYDLSPQMGEIAPTKPRFLENAHVYEIDPFDSKGTIDSMIISLIPYYNELLAVKQNSYLAQYQLARPVRIEETPEKKISDGSISNSSDVVALHNEVAQAQGISIGGSDGMDKGKGGGGGAEGNMAAHVDSLARSYVNAMNNLNNQERQLLHNSEYLTSMKERKMLKDGRIELDPGKLLVSNKMMKAEAPANVQEVEIAWNQRVYESLGIPRTMATSEGSKTSTNQNSQELYDQMRLESVNFLERFLTETYNTMFQIDNKYSYWINKQSQYHQMKATAKVINKRKRRLSKQQQGAIKRRKTGKGEEERTDDPEYDSDWDEDINTKFDEMFAANCTQQEEYDCTNVKVIITGAKPVASITDWRAAGYLNGKGSRALFIETTKIPDEYVNDESKIDEFTEAGLQTEDESCGGIAEKTEKAKAKKAQTQGT